MSDKWRYCYSKGLSSTVLASLGEPALFHQDSCSLRLELWPHWVQSHSHLTSRAEIRDIQGKTPIGLAWAMCLDPPALAMVTGVAPPPHHGEAPGQNTETAIPTKPHRSVPQNMSLTYSRGALHGRELSSGLGSRQSSLENTRKRPETYMRLPICQDAASIVIIPVAPCSF